MPTRSAATEASTPPDVMESMVLTADRGLERTTSPIPSTQPGDALVMVIAAGVCGTELHFLDGILDPGGAPRILGHEVAGIVVDGGGVHKPGTRVAVYNVMNCGSCSYCRSGRDRLCSNTKGMIGFNRDGGFAEYLAVPAVNIVPLPDGVSLDAAAVLACSGMTAVHAVRRAGVELGSLVVVNGIGGVGVMLIQAARLAGATVVAIGDHDQKLELAEESGASRALLVEDRDHYTTLESRFNEHSIDRPLVFFETVGTTESIHAGLRLLAANGAFVQIGYTADHIDVHPSLLIRNELSIISSAAGSKRDLETAIALAASGRIEAKTTLLGGLGELESALQLMRDRKALRRSVIMMKDQESD